MLAVVVAALLIAGVICLAVGSAEVGIILLVIGAILAVVLIGLYLAGRPVVGRRRGVPPV